MHILQLNCVSEGSSLRSLCIKGYSAEQDPEAAVQSSVSTLMLQGRPSWERRRAVLPRRAGHHPAGLGREGRLNVAAVIFSNSPHLR